MSTIVINPSKLEPTRLSFRTSMGCTASLMPERFRDRLDSTVHTLPVFSPDVALSIALDAQAVAARQGMTCRGASLKARSPSPPPACRQQWALGWRARVGRSSRNRSETDGRSGAAKTDACSCVRWHCDRHLPTRMR